MAKLAVLEHFSQCMVQYWEGHVVLCRDTIFLIVLIIVLDILSTTHSIVTRAVENARATVVKDSFRGQFSQVQTQAQVYTNSS